MTWNTAEHAPEAVARRAPIVRIDPDNRFALDPTFLGGFAGRQPTWGPLGYVTYKRTYARPYYDDRGRVAGSEEFWQTLQRVTEGTFSLLKQQIREKHRHWSDEEGQHKAQEFYRRMWAFKWLPPGRGLWIMGTPYLEKHGGGAANNCGFVSTGEVDRDFAEPFVALMDWSMLGVGMGFDVRGAGKVRIQAPARGEDVHVVHDTREGWVDLIRRALLAYVGRATLPASADTSRVRDEGLPIRGFGGTSSGPGPLLALYAAVCRLLDALVGQVLTSEAIVDLMNLIGRCVVAGNVRRSSEIAIGFHDDAAFLALKDNARSRQVDAEKRRVELSHSIDLEAMRARQRAHSPLSPEFAAAQGEIDRARAMCRDFPEWAALDAEQWRLPLNAWRWASNNTVLCDPVAGPAGPLFPDYARLGRQTAGNGEPGYAWLETIRRHGRLSDPADDRDRHALGFNPCSEQTLWDRELCCLVETFPNKHEDVEDYERTLKYAYMYAKVVSGVPTHRPDTNAVMAANRRIGTSMAGVAAMYDRLGLRRCVDWWRRAYAFVQELDAEYSRWMACPRSIKTTSIKPGGSVPLLVGPELEEGGMKWPSGRHFMRTIRIDHMSPMVEVLRAHGYRVEPDHYTPRSVVAYFPVRVEAPRYAPEVSMWEQAELVAQLQAHWSDNMVSATVTFSAAEAPDLGRLVEAYAGRVKAISFLPVAEHGYLQAPYIPCSAEEYEAAVARLRPGLEEALAAASVHDVDDRFCAGDKCEVPAPGAPA